MTTIEQLTADEAARRRHFPVTAERIFLAHAGVSALPRVAVEAMQAYLEVGSKDAQDNPWDNAKAGEARKLAGRLLGCNGRDIALLGPTSLGINLVAQGLPWESGDHIVYYPDDYPANVYPWANLASKGVVPTPLEPPAQGAITWDIVEEALTPNTKLVALATANFLSGYRIDIDDIGKRLRSRGILFCVDAIQTLGAFPISVENVDFLCADSHKWMLGPCGAGIFYVDPGRQELLRPPLLGAWNVVSPQYIAQETVRFQPGARRYESGTLNLPGILGMGASMELILDIGVENIAARIIEWRQTFLDALRPLGWELCIEEVDRDPATPDATRTGIIAITHPDKDIRAVAQTLDEGNVRFSSRANRAGRKFLRFSPHFYNAHNELDRVVELLKV